MFFWNKYCDLTAIFFLCCLFSKSQTLTSKIPDQKNFSFNQVSASQIHYNLNKKQSNNLPSFSSFSVIQQDYYTQHFGIMCKQELAIEKATRIPFRFRLGSLQQCNFYEGKK
jgi:hypothetical protein